MLDGQLQPLFEHPSINCPVESWAVWSVDWSASSDPLFIWKATTARICQSTSTVPYIHVILKRLVHQDNPTASFSTSVFCLCRSVQISLRVAQSFPSATQRCTWLRQGSMQRDICCPFLGHLMVNQSQWLSLDMSSTNFSHIFHCFSGYHYDTVRLWLSEQQLFQNYVLSGSLATNLQASVLPIWALQSSPGADPTSSY